jgi:hypothetical protein
MKAREQSFQAGLLGTAAFHAGKSRSPTEDRDFLELLLSCGDRRVGHTPTGEAPTLDLLGAWIRHWSQSSASHARPASLVIAKHTVVQNTACEPRRDAHPGSLTKPSPDANSPLSD